MKKMTGFGGSSYIGKNSKCAVIVAHPDDETLWAGGTILLHPDANWTIITICRRSDPHRAPRFFRCLEVLNASGAMGDFDDDPQQKPLNLKEVQREIVALLPSERFDLIITHSQQGEYTRHLRHEETAKAVFALWKSKEILAGQLWQFAYKDDGGKYLPKAIEDADIVNELPKEIWQKKYEIITDIYGFAPDSFEARVTPRQEAFWRVACDRQIKE
jgi:LmbE family N-acetylglucosaminyl deacetylase